MHRCGWCWCALDLVCFQRGVQRPLQCVCWMASTAAVVAVCYCAVPPGQVCVRTAAAAPCPPWTTRPGAWRVTRMCPAPRGAWRAAQAACRAARQRAAELVRSRCELAMFWKVQRVHQRPIRRRFWKRRHSLHARLVTSSRVTASGPPACPAPSQHEAALPTRARCSRTNTHRSPLLGVAPFAWLRATPCSTSRAVSSCLLLAGSWTGGHRETAQAVHRFAVSCSSPCQAPAGRAGRRDRTRCVA